MYKGASQGIQSRRDRGLSATRSGRTKAAKKGKPKTKKHTRLEAAAADAQLTSWKNYIDRCLKTGTTPFVPADIRRRLNMDEA
jgi:hypothetical protein